MEEKKIENVSLNEEKGRCVYAAPVARSLVRKGYSVIDIKPNRENHDRTVFVFKETDDFNTAMEEILKVYSEKKSQKSEQKRLNEITRRTFL